MLQKIISITPFLLSFLTSLAGATSFFPQPFPDTVKGAPIIVRGKAGASYSDWNNDDFGGKRIYTFYDLQPTEVLKGNINKSSSLSMRELGGEKDGVGLTVPGVSEFEKGEDTVVFLKERNSSGSYDVQGMMMGKYNIQKDADGTEYLTGMGLNNFNHLGNNTDVTPAASPPKKWTLNDLRTLIRSQAGSEANSEGDKSVQDSNPNTKTLSSPPTLPRQAGPSPVQIPDPQTSPSTPIVESTDPGSGFPNFWIFILTLAGAIVLRQFIKTRRKG
ncbi:MAG: hypothetical protein ABIQ95_15185 [Bdellovibrionia bacterium]